VSRTTRAQALARRSWRWGVVAAGTAVLLLLPSVVGALPARTTTLSAQELLRRVRASHAVAWSGYGESRGALGLPDVDQLGDLPALLGDTTRVRAWWRGPDDWRADALTLVDETDTTRDPGGSWTWRSADLRAVRVEGELAVRLPAAPDLLAPVLGRRLAGADDVDASRLPARRVAGRAADGLRLVPRAASSTTVAQVDLWVDPAHGLVLRVEVTARGRAEPSLVAVLLEVDLRRPPAERTSFAPPPDASTTVARAPDLAALADRFAPWRLPDRLAGLPRHSRSASPTAGGVASYGRGFTALTVVPVPVAIALRIVRRVEPEGEERSAAVRTPLFSALVSAEERRRAYLLVGTVPRETLSAALAELRADPPRSVR